jgi:hypothetical protein
MKMIQMAMRTAVVLIFFTPLMPAQAQETMLGAHGGGGSQGFGSPGSISVINQSNANTMTVGTPSPGVGLAGVATNSAGRIFASTGVNKQNPGTGPRLIEINPATGAMLKDIGRLRVATGENCYIGDLSFQPGTDVLYGVLAENSDGGGCTWQGSTETGGVLVTVNTSNATVTIIGRDASLGNSNGGLAFHPNGTLYFTPCWIDDSRLITLNPATAAILSSKAMDAGSCYMGLAARPSDGTLFASYNWENGWDPYVLVTLNPANGKATLVGHTYTSVIHDLTFTDAIDVGFHINVGMSDAWYDPLTIGQGFLISVFEDTGIVFVAWFTFDTQRPPMSATANLGEPGHRWVTAQGPIDGDTAELTVYLSEGGTFDSPTPPVAPAVPIGSITIVWHDCEHATLTYDIDPPDVNGVIEIKRIVLDSVKYCEAYQP